MPSRPTRARRSPAQGVAETSTRVSCSAHLRYQGTDTPLDVPFASVAEMTAAFEAVHRQRFGFLMQDRPLVVEALSAEAIGVGRERHASHRRERQRFPGAGRIRAGLVRGRLARRAAT